MFKFCQNSTWYRSKLCFHHSPTFTLLSLHHLCADFAPVLYQIVLECFGAFILPSVFRSLRAEQPTAPCCQNNDWQEGRAVCDGVSVKCSGQFDGHKSSTSLSSDLLNLQFPICPWMTFYWLTFTESFDRWGEKHTSHVSLYFSTVAECFFLYFAGIPTRHSDASLLSVYFFFQLPSSL